MTPAGSWAVDASLDGFALDLLLAILEQHL
jgi:hypothetical protein